MYGPYTLSCVPIPRPIPWSPPPLPWSMNTRTVL
jgi:hypothetical protein